MMAEAFRYEHRVTYAECTLGNHVYHSRYLDLLEAARGAFFRHLDQPFLKWQEQDRIFPIIECQLRYKSPARYDDILTIEVRLQELKGIRLRFVYGVWNRDRREILTGSTLHVCTSIDEKPKRFPEELAAVLRPYIDTAIDGGRLGIE